jgi:hypothetical protein
MNKARQIKLRKELERFEPFASSLTRQDYVSGRWLSKFMEHMLGSYSVTTSPDDVRARHEGVDDEDLIDAVVSKAVFEALDVTEAHPDAATGTDIRMLTDRKLGGKPQKLGGGAAMLITELIHVLKQNVDMVFDIAAIMRRRMDAGKSDLIADVFGYSLGNFDWDEAKAPPEAPDEDDHTAYMAEPKPVKNPMEVLGARIFDRAIAQTLSGEYPLSMRKAFYCYFVKSVGAHTPENVVELPEWVEEKVAEGPATGAMTFADPDELGVLGDMMA